MALDFNFICQSTPSGNYTNDLTVTLAPIVQPGINVAPTPIWFEVSDVTGSNVGTSSGARIPRFHDLVYVWDFGDAANATPSTAAALNMPSAWKDINRGYGRQVCHVYNDPSPVGGYVVTCTVYERSTRRMGSATVNVTVGDPRAIFTGNRTIIYNPNSINLAPFNYPGHDPRTTWAGVLSARNTLGATTAQILFAPGSELVGTQLVNDPSWGNIRIGALDMTQPKPVIRGYLTEGNAFLIRDYNTDKTERVVFGLRFEGDWDSTTETGRILRPFGTFNNTNAAGYLAMQHRCEFDGWELVGPHIGNPANPVFNVHSELVVTNWQNYGLQGCNGGGAHRSAVIACSVFQHPDALSGGMKDTGFYNNHGCFRGFGDRRVFISVCDMFSRNGWSVGGTDASGGSIPADQACIRINTNGIDDVQVNGDRIAMEGMMWLEEQDSSNIDRPGNYVFDKVLQVLSSRTLIEANEIRVGGFTARNWLAVSLNVPSAQGNRLSQLFSTANTNGSTTPFNNDEPIELSNITLLDLRDEVNSGGVTLALRRLFNEPGAVDFTNITTLNNVIHQPNRTPPIVPEAPLDLSTNITFTPRHRGPRFNFQRLQFTLPTTIAIGADLTLQYAWLRQGKYDLRGDSGTLSAPARTVSVTNGSAIVTGSGTSWNADDWTGATFVGPDGVHYLVASRDSATQLTLVRPYAGTTVSGSASYSLTAYNPGAVTAQAYWNANRGFRSKIEIGGTTYHEAAAQFAVTFNAGDVTIRNNSASSWAAGALAYIMLDRRGAIPAFDPAFDVRSMTIPLAIPTAGSAAINSASGSLAYDDLLLAVRPATGDERGALLTA